MTTLIQKYKTKQSHKNVILHKLTAASHSELHIHVSWSLSDNSDWQTFAGFPSLSANQKSQQTHVLRATDKLNFWLAFEWKKISHYLVIILLKDAHTNSPLLFLLIVCRSTLRRLRRTEEMTTISRKGSREFIHVKGNLLSNDYGHAEDDG